MLRAGPQIVVWVALWTWGYKQWWQNFGMHKKSLEICTKLGPSLQREAINIKVLVSREKQVSVAI